MATSTPRGRGRPHKNPKTSVLESQPDLHPRPILTNHTHHQTSTTGSPITTLCESLSTANLSQGLKHKRESLSRKDRKKCKLFAVQEKNVEQEEAKNEPKIRFIHIRVADPYATDSSSSSDSEEEKVRGRSKIEVHKIAMLDNDYSCSLGKECVKQRRSGARVKFMQCPKRERTERKAKKHEGKVHAALSSSSSISTVSFEAIHASKEEPKSSELCETVMEFEVPGPIPDLEELMMDESVWINFFEGLPDEWDEDV